MTTMLSFREEAEEIIPAGFSLSLAASVAEVLAVEVPEAVEASADLAAAAASAAAALPEDGKFDYFL